jgi:hypothetical protein
VEPGLENLDPWRLAAAAHELGHLVCFRAANIQVTEIVVRGHGERVSGHVWVPAQPLPDKSVRLYLSANLAGRAADLRWCDEVGMKPLPERTCADDWNGFRKHRRELGTPHWQSTHQSDARRVVAAHWALICRWAPKLARRGSLPVNAIS